MSKSRNIRRQKQRQQQSCYNVLATLLAEFYDYLGNTTPQPTDDEVRATFKNYNQKWKKYCRDHQLMNIDHLFVLNVGEWWKRHTVHQE